jgi:hypothetical protein
VVADAAALLTDLGVAERCRLVGGDFFASVPEGCDAYTMKMVIHDWDDEPAGEILRTVGEAMHDGATLVVLERILDPPNEGRDAKFDDLNMLVNPGGRERTRAEYDALFAAAGFRRTRDVAAGALFSVIEGVRV